MIFPARAVRPVCLALAILAGVLLFSPRGSAGGSPRHGPRAMRPARPAPRSSPAGRINGAIGLVDFLSPRLGWVEVGGALRWTRDEGATWSPVTIHAGPYAIPSRPPTVPGSARPAFDPQSVSFVSPGAGWAWGPGRRRLARGAGPGVLARTFDGGRTWAVVPTSGIDYAQTGGYPPIGASGVRFLDRQQGYLFGSALYATADGGRHWSETRTPGQILDLEVGAGRAYALVLGCARADTCTTAHLDRIADGGRTFIEIGPMASVNFRWSTLVIHGLAVYLLTPSADSGTDLRPAALWASRDGGLTWRREPAPCRWVGADGGALAAWSGSGLALACGGEPGAGNQEKAFYFSTDGGARWQQVAGRIPGARLLAPMTPGYVVGLAAGGRNTWALAEGRGTLLITRDGGRNWRPAHFTGREAALEGWGYVAFIDPADAVAVPWTLNGSVLAFTQDAARDWSEVGFPSGR